MGEMNFNNTFCLTQYIQNIVISTHNQYEKNVNGIFYTFFTSLQNPVYILLLLHISGQTTAQVLNIFPLSFPSWQPFTLSPSLQRTMQQRHAHLCLLKGHCERSGPPDPTLWDIWKHGGLTLASPASAGSLAVQCSAAAQPPLPQTQGFLGPHPLQHSLTPTHLSNVCLHGEMIPLCYFDSNY